LGELALEKLTPTTAVCVALGVKVGVEVGVEVGVRVGVEVGWPTSTTATAKSPHVPAEFSARARMVYSPAASGVQP